MSGMYQAEGFSSADVYRSATASPAPPPPQQQQHPSPFDSDAKSDKSDDWDVREEVLNARMRALAGSRPREPSFDADFPQPSHDIRRSLGGESTFLDYNSVHEYGRPPHARAGRSKMSQFSTRKSLLDPASFGFDVQNADARQFTGEKHVEHHASTPAGGVNEEDDARVELITVPAFGQEYDENEVREMRKHSRRQRKARSTRENCAAFLKTDNRVCGCIDPRVAVFLAFAFIGGLILMLYFVIPRVPEFAVQTMTPLVAIPNAGAMQTHHSPTNFSMDMNVNMRADTHGAWLRVKASKLTMDVTDISNAKKIGTGHLDGFSFPARTLVPFQFPVHFAYASINATGDATWLHWINACGPRYPGTPRSSLNLQFTLEMKISGLIGTKGTSTQLGNIECPFTLQPDQT